MCILVTVYLATVNLTCPRFNFNTTITTTAKSRETPPAVAPAITGTVLDDDEAMGTLDATAVPGTSDVTVVLIMAAKYRARAQIISVIVHTFEYI